MLSGNELDAVHRLAEGTNLIHIGPEKTGSTAIQSAFAALRPRLADSGVLYPGNPERPRPYLEALGFHGQRGAPPRDPAEWQDLLDEVAAASASRVLISHEQLGRATDDQVRQVVASLGGERPHVLMVARRYDTFIPSQWQQGVKARTTLSYEEYLRLVMREDDSHVLWQTTWRPHDTAEQVRRWGSVVGEDAVTVVVANDQDHGFLFGVFERLFGLPDGSLREHVVRSNRSLTYPEVELLRQFAIDLKERGGTLEDFHRLMRQGVLRAMRTQPVVEGEPPVPPLPRWAMDFARRRSEQRVSDLQALQAEGLHIIGDLGRLEIPADAPMSEDLLPPAVVSLETAVRVSSALVRIEMRGQRRLKRRARRATQRGAAEPPASTSLLSRFRR
ncbi:hypothetical protein [Nocardioides daejeonensis]|uniref:hypothetical protein n=1 Tax=Nocardioides daejeonensis TaxID=1046556 RepID=UPI000D744E13|nr:hypothetical protein [Nocardioides daejeonensis]